MRDLSRLSNHITGTQHRLGAARFRQVVRGCSWPTGREGAKESQVEGKVDGSSESNRDESWILVLRIFSGIACVRVCGVCRIYIDESSVECTVVCCMYRHRLHPNGLTGTGVL